MSAPTNKKQVQSIIGMINYLPIFSARLSEIVDPIRELAKDKVPLQLGPRPSIFLYTDETSNFMCSHIGSLQS